MPDLSPKDAAALAAEHGGVLCFVSSDNEQTADMAVLSLWKSRKPEIVLLRLQNEDNNIVIRMRWKDLSWLVNEGPQEQREALADG